MKRGAEKQLTKDDGEKEEEEGQQRATPLAAQPERKSVHNPIAKCD